MTQVMLLDELAEAVERLPDDDHEALFEKMKRRRAETGHARILATADEVRREYAEGKCVIATPEEIMAEALS